MLFPYRSFPSKCIRPNELILDINRKATQQGRFLQIRIAFFVYFVNIIGTPIELWIYLQLYESVKQAFIWKRYMMSIYKEEKKRLNANLICAHSL
jgi:hypothetical protein